VQAVIHSLYDHVAAIGVAGFAGFWAAKAAVSYSVYRVWKRRRSRRLGVIEAIAPTKIGTPPGS